MSNFKSDILDAQEGETTEILPESAPIKAHLKWFNGPKGFGFVVPEGEEIDAFLHITTMQKAGLQNIGDGACVLCEIDRGPKGAHVRKILEVLDIGTLPENHKKPNEKASGPQTEKLEMEGVVKWYKPNKGFGFIVPDDGLKDVFIHQSCLEKHGVESLQPGQRIIMTFKVVEKGREVETFRLLEE